MIQKISVPPSYLENHEQDVISNIVFEYMRDQGIETESFAWSIDIQYVEDEV